MGIGICCQWLGEIKGPNSKKTKIDNLIQERTLQLNRYRSGLYSNEQILDTYINNISEVSRILELISSTTSIRHFRISSNLIPLMDKVQRSMWDNETIEHHLAALGNKIKSLGFRVSTHPGQFTVLSSDRDDIVESSVRELENQSWLFDKLGLPSGSLHTINIHGGKSDRESRLIDSIGLLSISARSRLTLENDESCYSVRQLLKVSEKTSVPIVFDSHHHSFNSHDMSGKEAALEAAKTWPNGIVPIQHLSNTEPEHASGSFTDRRKHSYALHYIPDYQLEMLNFGMVDVEMEFKGKNLGVLPHLDSVGIARI